MAYNISKIDIVSGELQITPARLLRFSQGLPDDALPSSMLSALENPESMLDGCRLTRIPWYGEWSGHTENMLRHFLSLCDGDAALLLCWEGGESYSGLIVKGGTVSDGEVVQTVVPKDAP